MTVIVLAMHGAPPNDFPPAEMGEFMSLHAQWHRLPSGERSRIAEKYAQLGGKMRDWPRSAANDPYWAASHTLAQELAQQTGEPVIVGFNEFCGPNLDQALDTAAQMDRDVIVITPMMTHGGEHSEKDIPAAIRAASNRHPQATIRFVWPFPTQEIAGFLAAQIAAYRGKQED